MQIDQKYIEVKGNKLWTKTISPEGAETNSRTIVLLHDALGSIEQWKDYPSRLAAATNRPVFLYDRFGHGKSDELKWKYDQNYFEIEAQEVLPEVLRLVKIENPIIYGHSDGGTIALIYGSKHLAAALILEASHVLSEKLTRKGVLGMASLKPNIVDALRKYHGMRSEMLFDRWYDLWSGTRMKDWNIEKKLMHIDCPVLIIQGENDNYATTDQVNRIASGVTGRNLILMMKNSGHHPHKDEPEMLLKEIAEFIQ